MGKATTAAITYEAEAIRNVREYAGDAARRVKEMEARVAELEAQLAELRNNKNEEEALREMMRDPRYWRHRDPEWVNRVRDGFRRLVGGKDE